VFEKKSTNEAILINQVPLSDYVVCLYIVAEKRVGLNDHVVGGVRQSKPSYTHLLLSVGVTRKLSPQWIEKAS